MKKRLRLSVRGLLLLILSFAVWLGWQVHLARKQKEAVAAVEAYGGYVIYDWEYVTGHSHDTGKVEIGQKGSGKSPSASAWLRRTIGDDFFQDVVAVNLAWRDEPDGTFVSNPRETDDVIERLLAFPHLKSLYIHGAQATDRGMSTIGRLRNLEVLSMEGATITDAGFAKLSRLRNLRQLDITNVPVTDAGIAKLSGLKNLKVLVATWDHEGSGKLTDLALKSLATIPHLEVLDLDGHRFSDRGLSYLRNMKDMRSLGVATVEEGSDVTNLGLVYLKNMHKLELLNIYGTKVTDEGLVSLESLKSLRMLITDSTVSDEAFKRLQSKLPKLGD